MSGEREVLPARGVGYRFGGSNEELVQHLREGERDLHIQWVEDPNHTVECALPAYIGEAAERLAALSPPVRDPVVGELVEALERALGWVERHAPNITADDAWRLQDGPGIRAALRRAKQPVIDRANLFASTPDSSLQEGAGNTASNDTSLHAGRDGE